MRSVQKCTLRICIKGIGWESRARPLPYFAVIRTKIVTEEIWEGCAYAENLDFSKLILAGLFSASNKPEYLPVFFP